jgi:predicted Rossmann fold flavoprotein
MQNDYDVIIIGAGAAGLMCAITAGKRGRRVCVLDHSKKIGTKIRISGGGRCNFTNLYASAEHYLSNNPHFCKSALKQYTQYDFIDWVEESGIPYHEKKLGQLFCDRSAQDIIDMLLRECRQQEVTLKNPVQISRITSNDGVQSTFSVETCHGTLCCQSLVIATGGLSIPKSGATSFGYEIAKQFGLNIVDTRAGLVPLTFQGDLLERCRSLAGLSVDASVSTAKTHFAEGLLFTHRGLSGPSILQISSYWTSATDISVNLCPELDMLAVLRTHKAERPKQTIQTVLAEYLPKRLVASLCELHQIDGRLGECADRVLQTVAEALQQWAIRPGGNEGYRTAEVTLGGVDTQALSSKTMAAKTQPNLFFIGEVVDVTGHLGGFNFQWSWSSGFAAGQNC